MIDRLASLEQSFVELRRHLLAIDARDLVARLDALLGEIGSELTAPTAPVAGTVLLVDDEPSLVFLMQEYLDGDGHRLVAANNGREAQAILEAGNEHFDAVLLDRRMPQMNGLELLAWMQADPRFAGLPVIMQTAAGSLTEALGGLRAGAWFYLVKPYDMSVLKAIVQVALRQRRRG